MNRQGTPVPRAICRVGWGTWFTRDHIADAKGRLTMQIPDRSRLLEVRGQASVNNSHVYLFVHFHPLEPGVRMTRVVVRQKAQIRGTVSGADSGTVYAWRPRHAESREEVSSVYTKGGVSQMSTTRISDDGSFVMVLPDDQPVVLLFEGKLGEQSVYGIARSVDPGTRGVRLHAHQDESEINILVLNWQGRPVEGVKVALSESTAGPTMGSMGRVDVGLTGPIRKTDRHGRATLTGAAAHLHELITIAREEWSPTLVTAYEPVVPGPEELVVRLRAPSTTLQGTVRLPNGRPASGARVFATHDDSLFPLGNTDRNGRFRTQTELVAGTTLHVFAAHPQSTATARGYLYDCTVGDPEWRIVLEEIGPLTADESKAAVTARLASVRHLLPTKGWRSESEKGHTDRPKAAIEAGEKRLLALLDEVATIGSSHKRVRAAIHTCVRDWNKLNERHGPFMDTTAREELVAFFEQVAGAVGMDLPDDLPRDW